MHSPDSPIFHSLHCNCHSPHHGYTSMLMVTPLCSPEQPPPPCPWMSISDSALPMASNMCDLWLNANHIQWLRSATFTSARPVSNSVTPRGSCTYLHRLLTFRKYTCKIVTHKRLKANLNLFLSTRYQLEHGLTPEGRYDEARADEVGSSGSYDTFYTETSGGKYVPRAIFADLDPSVRGKHIPRSLKCWSPSGAQLTRANRGLVI